MKIVSQHVEDESIKETTTRNVALLDHLRQDYTDALSSRSTQEARWKESLRQYEAIPKNSVVNTPIENAPNIEVPFTMMSVDIFYSVALENMFNISPAITISPTPGRADAQAKAEALQDFANYGTRNHFGLRTAANNTVLDNILLGTGVYVIPWIINRKKGKVNRVKHQHPQIQPWPIEDVIVTGGIHQDIQNIPAIHLRSYYTHQELLTVGKINKLDLSQTTPTSGVSDVRSKREQLGQTHTDHPAKNGIYEIVQSYIYYDYDGDGWDEDLLVYWDFASGRILRVMYNPYDRRPLEVMRYHPRAYLFYGMGMPEKLAPLQSEITDTHNHRILNMVLANSRMWQVKGGAGMGEDFKVWPGKVINVTEMGEIEGVPMADVYSSSQIAEQSALQLASNLVGLNEMNPARSSSLFSSRTPATTAALGSGMQNQRFASSFNSIRDASSGAVIQCLYRYQERLLAGDKEVERMIEDSMGDQASLIIETLKNEAFDEEVDIELTATSRRTTQEAQVQNLMQIGQLLNQYHDRALQLAEIASNPQASTPLREAAAKIHDAATEVIERTLRTIDTVRDPKTFLVDIDEQIDDAAQIADVDTVNQLQGIFAQADALEAAQAEAAALDNQPPSEQ